MDDNLSPSVAAVVARMEDHPEEFFEVTHKWSFLFQRELNGVLTEAEQKALQDGINVIRRKEFDARVMRALLIGDSDKVGPRSAQMNLFPSPTLPLPQTLKR